MNVPLDRRGPVRKGIAHLPSAGRAWIPTSPTNKLKDYALKPDHPKGGPKAEWFRSQLGIVQDDWEFLHDQILERVPGCWIVTIGPINFEHGLAVGVEIPIDGRNGRAAPVLTGWLVPFGGSPAPKLTTVIPQRFSR